MPTVIAVAVATAPLTVAAFFMYLRACFRRCLAMTRPPSVTGPFQWGKFAIAQVKNVLWITSRLPMQCVAQANARFGQLKVLTLCLLGGLPDRNPSDGVL